LNIVADRHAGAAVLAIIIQLARILGVARWAAVLVVVALALKRARQIDAGALAAPVRLLQALVPVFFTCCSGETKLHKYYIIKLVSLQGSFKFLYFAN
jgi:hypothetical protein